MIDWKSLLGRVRRWLSVRGGAPTKATSAPAVQSRSSASGTAGRTAIRPGRRAASDRSQTPRCPKPRKATTAPVARSAGSSVAATSSSMPWSTRNAPWYRTIGGRAGPAGRPIAAASRPDAIGPGVSGCQAGGLLSRHDRRRDAEPAGDLGRQGRRRREHPGGLADQGLFAASNDRAQHARQLHQASRLGVQVGDVVDEPAPPASCAADRCPGDGQGDERFRMGDLGVRCRGGDCGGPVPPRRTVARISRPRRSGARSRSPPRAGPHRKRLRFGRKAGQPQQPGTERARERTQAAGDAPVEDDPAQLDPLGQRCRRRAAPDRRRPRPSRRDRPRPGSGPS